MPEQEGVGQLSLRTGVREAVTVTQNHGGKLPLHGYLHIFACICITKSVESALMVPAFEDWQELKRVGVTGRAQGILEGNREKAVAAMLGGSGRCWALLRGNFQEKAERFFSRYPSLRAAGKGAGNSGIRRAEEEDLGPGSGGSAGEEGPGPGLVLEPPAPGPGKAGCWRREGLALRLPLGGRPLGLRSSVPRYWGAI